MEGGGDFLLWLGWECLQKGEVFAHFYGNEPIREANRLMLYNWQQPDWPDFRYDTAIFQDRLSTLVGHATPQLVHHQLQIFRYQGNPSFHRVSPNYYAKCMM